MLHQAPTSIQIEGDLSFEGEGELEKEGLAPLLDAHHSVLL